MQMFRHGHATHPNWRTACELVMLQLEEVVGDMRAGPPQRLASVFGADISPPGSAQSDRLALDWLGRKLATCEVQHLEREVE